MIISVSSRHCCLIPRRGTLSVLLDVIRLSRSTNEVTVKQLGLVRLAVIMCQSCRCDATTVVFLLCWCSYDKCISVCTSAASGMPLCVSAVVFLLQILLSDTDLLSTGNRARFGDGVER